MKALSLVWMPNSLPLKSILTLESVTIWLVYPTMRLEKVILESLLPYKILALLLLYIQIMCLKVVMMEVQSIINTMLLPTFVKANKHLSSVQSRANVDAVGRWNVFENIRTYQEKV